MTNFDVMKNFVKESNRDIDYMVAGLRKNFCPPEDFQERYPCDKIGSCGDCWKKYLELDDGWALTIDVDNVSK